MSLDDFVITHFTKGIGVNTLSTMIYTEQKKGIRPEIYSLSTLMFITVFILLVLYNKYRESAEKKKAAVRTSRVRYYAAAACVPVFAILLFIGYRQTSAVSTDKLNLYSYGEYLALELIEEFEKETGIKVTSDEYDTNETMYPIIAKGAADYDLVCPSDYMVKRMAEEGLWKK